MKLNTSMFICLFFSAIIAIKAQSNKLSDDNENDLMVDEDQQTQNSQEETEFQYKQSKWLEEMENNMTDSSEVFVEDGEEKEALTNTFTSAMATDVAKAGFTDANHQWQLMLEGPEASRVIGTFGQNFNSIVSSNNAANMINMLASTTHVLAATAGEAKMSSGLRDILSMMSSLFTSPNMPIIVNKVGLLVISTVNKPNGPLFSKTYWDEIQNLLSVKNLNEKLQKTFENLSTMTSSSKKTKPLKRRRSFA
ncbi:PREDICTED: uncharacterized protein LOC107161780 [Diuraphis noxia]|uniref:uncharacterized protein LOC107161780 n=1 Tax=Diuraphis noxia TaxID=143948 RepID=UPI0007638962|nr:PREDICTED: uncharacterized protein LOC107161780 [Diuraphis noxia]